VSQTWFITGSSRGLGRALALEVLARGGKVVAAARNPAALAPLAEAHPGRVLAPALDVRDAAQVAAAVSAAESWSGGIDVLVNNAGHGMQGAVEEVSDAEARAVFDVNVFGLLAVTRAVLPGMRARGRGHVVNLSSIAGLMGSAGTGIYSATKFAVEGLSESLAKELEPLGIGVTLVEPGPFRTDFNGDSLSVAGNAIAAYSTVSERTAALRKASGQQPGDPAKAARVMFEAVTAAEPPLHLILGRQAYVRFEEKRAGFTRDNAAWRDKAVATEVEN
jgi:NAD(P)-dependent dehydrogenase (short-subunit alcohol dehydrogenase family)